MQYDLVFEGGGAKGMAFVGALRAFEAAGHTHGRLMGTSAGAISATMLAAGYSSAEMATALSEMTDDGRAIFETFMAIPKRATKRELTRSRVRKLLADVDIRILPNFAEKHLDRILLQTLTRRRIFRHLYSLVEHGGWFTAAAFVKWFSAKLDATAPDGTKRAFSKMTLSEFHAATGKHLTVIGADTTDSRMLVLNHKTAPDLPVVWAVRMSMSIPLLWPEVVWRKKWGAYRGADMSAHRIVDGGLLSNFPIELFVSTQPRVLELMGQDTAPGGVIGFIIDEQKPVPGTSSKPAKKKGLTADKLQTVQRLKRLVNTVTMAHDKMVIDTVADRVVRLPAKGFGTTEFDMSEKRRAKLVDSGESVMDGFLAQLAAPGPGLEGVGPGARKANQLAASILGF